MYTEGYVFHVAGAFIFASDGDFLGIAQVLLGDACDFRAHGSGEQQGVALLRHIGENGVDAVCESHVQHFVRFVHNHVLYGGGDTVLRSIRSSSRPGVATMMCTPRFRARIWLSMDEPPYTGNTRKPSVYLE